MADKFPQCWKMFVFVSFMIVPLLGSLRISDLGHLSHPGCGVIPTTSSISGGKAGTYPWMAFLYLMDSKDTFCGGSMISDLQVLTAAHCVVGKTTDNIGVIIGNQNAGEELTNYIKWIIGKIKIPVRSRPNSTSTMSPR